MEIYTSSQARANFFKLLEHVVEAHDPIYIIGKHKAVLIAEADYRAMVETLYLTSVPGMKESILSATKEPIENFSNKLDWDNEENV